MEVELMSEAATSVLVIDDEPAIVQAIEILLRKEGYAAHVATDGSEGISRMASLRPDVVISDVRMPTMSGLDVLAAARSLDAEMPVILMTAQATVPAAVQAVNDGAFYFLEKPFGNEQLLAIVRRAAEHRRLRAENRTLKAEIRRREHIGRPVGNSAPWVEVLKVAETVAPTESTVLLQGESGTGKEVVARYLHELSARANGPFLSINCGALPESLLESELFGHVRGSFTGAVRDKQGLFTAAGAGTFFLDEIGETTPATQVKLLRVLQHREVIPVGATAAIPINTRLIAATNRDLEEEIKRGAFRTDLFYRLNVIAIHLPPLRQRREDIPVLAELFLRRTAESNGERQKSLDPEVVEVLHSYAWPGNVRELENALERAALLTKGDVIGIRSLPERIVERRSEPLAGDRQAANPTLEVIERAYITWVLQQEGGNKTRASEALGIDPSTLYRKLARYGDNAGSAD
jgi:two-component system response regulator HydG